MVELLLWVFIISFFFLQLNEGTKSVYKEGKKEIFSSMNNNHNMLFLTEVRTFILFTALLVVSLEKVKEDAKALFNPPQKKKVF